MVFAAIGAFPDFPEAEELRLGYGEDSSMESLDWVASLERRRILARMHAAWSSVPWTYSLPERPLSRGAILATNNIREFSRVESLRLDDWTRT